MLRLALIFVACMFVVANSADASVVEHRVTPQNVSTTEGIDVRVETRANGDVVLTITVATAPAGVYAPRLRTRPGSAETQIAWVDSNAEPHVARVVVRAADVSTAEVWLMRDYGLIGHRYVLRVRDFR